MKIYNLPLTMENIEIFFFKKFKIPEKLKMMKSKVFYECILESISNDMFFLYKIEDSYYCTNELDFDINTDKEGQLFILNIPNIYINENHISYIVNILDLVNYNFEKTIQYNVPDIYVFFRTNDIVYNLNKELKIINIDKLEIGQDNSIYDIVINNKKTSFIGTNPNTQIIYKNENIIQLFLNKLFSMLKILSIIEKFYEYKNIYIINSQDEVFHENVDIYNLYNKNLKNIKIEDLIRIIDVLKKNDTIFHI